MINFRKIEINDKQWIDHFLAAANMRGCQHNFTNLFAWAAIYEHRIAKVEGYLVVKAKSPDGATTYFYPAGQGDPRTVIETMARDADAGRHAFLLTGLSIENIAVLDSLFPGQFAYKETRGSFDYIYLLDDLITLAGKKFSAKRNHVNHFITNNRWRFERISSANIAECWDMTVEWCKLHRCMYNEELSNENCAVRCCFDHFEELGLEGGLLRSEDRVIAYTIGDRLNADTYDIHIEKAFEDITGAYQMINREFAAFIKENHPEIIYVNREEDMGHEGLRKAKLSYHPFKMEEKYTGQFVGLK